MVLDTIKQINVTANHTTAPLLQENDPIQASLQLYYRPCYREIDTQSENWDVEVEFDLFVSEGREREIEGSVD